jgi:cytochrome c553
MRSLIAIPILLGLTTGVFAREVPPVAASCIECHAAAGNRTSLPRLEGQNQDYLRMTLSQFRASHRKAFPMNAIAADLADADIETLSAWFANQPWGGEPVVADPERVDAGAQLVQRFDCAACHGPAFAGTAVIPRTAGQNPIYLARQLRSFAGGERYHPPTGTGARMFRLDETEIEALAAYLAQLPEPLGDR